MNNFSYRDNVLFCEDVSVDLIAREVGTPFYLYSHAALAERCQAYLKGFCGRKGMVCFAVKSNSNIAVLNCLAKEGAGADIVSGGELFRALKAGVPGDRIVYSGVGKRDDEIKEALDAGILMFNIESEEELLKVSRIADDTGQRARIAIRVNPDVNPDTHPYISTGMKENKFGFSVEAAEQAYMTARDLPGIDIKGIDCHIGSQIIDIRPFCDAFERVKRLVARLEDAGVVLDYIDIGGGLGIRYDDEEPVEPGEYLKAIIRLSEGMPHTLIVEPGRSVSGNAGILVSKVLYSKYNGYKHFLVVDAAMNDLMRPSLYDAFHEIRPVVIRERGMVEADVVGPICETGDFLARGRMLP
jgi:diaminopimelate decarboxylase